MKSVLCLALSLVAGTVCAGTGEIVRINTGQNIVQTVSTQEVVVPASTQTVTVELPEQRYVVQVQAVATQQVQTVSTGCPCVKCDCMQVQPVPQVMTVQPTPAPVIDCQPAPQVMTVDNCVDCQPQVVGVQPAPQVMTVAVPPPPTDTVTVQREQVCVNGQCTEVDAPVRTSWRVLRGLRSARRMRH